MENTYLEYRVIDKDQNELSLASIPAGSGAARKLGYFRYSTTLARSSISSSKFEDSKIQKFFVTSLLFLFRSISVHGLTSIMRIRPRSHFC